MSDRTPMDVIQALDDLLEEERRALLSGNLDAITRLLVQKERLIDELSTLDHAEHAALRVLSGKVSRNQELLQHAVDGIKSVSDRLAEMRRLKNSLDTYDSSGTKTEIKVSLERNLEKRA